MTVTMKVEKLYVYPIKSLRGISLPSATLTSRGIPFDRQFMLLKEHKDASKAPKGARYENMHVAYFPEMCLFTTSITLPDTDNEGEIQVTYKDPKNGSSKSLQVPLQPDASELPPLEVSMHQSPVTALAMPQKYADWFSSCFGFDVVLAYLGPNNYRPVLGNLAPNAATRNPIRRERHESQHSKKSTASTSWISNFVNSMPGLPTMFNPSAGVPEDEDDDYQITFADCATYLIASTTSLADISSRLPGDEPMDITKFRPNIIVSGADSAFEEDFWAELSFSSSSASSAETRITLTANCVRCTSINVDYSTGAFGTGESGNVLKKMQKDRRVDMGHKYSPVFGRYGFLAREGGGVGEEGTVEVGDEVTVSRRNADRTIIRWPGLGQTPKEELFAL